MKTAIGLHQLSESFHGQSSSQHTMNFQIVLRRTGASKSCRNSLRRAGSSQIYRSYASPVASQQTEKDPQLGDYPQLPDVSRQYLPPKGWWDNQTRTNYGDTVCYPI